MIEIPIRAPSSSSIACPQLGQAKDITYNFSNPHKRNRIQTSLKGWKQSMIAQSMIARAT